MNKPGYCVYFFAHRGIGRIIQNVNNMKEYTSKIRASGDAYHIACDTDKKTAIRKYNKLKNSSNKKKKTKKKKNKKTKKKKNKKTKKKTKKLPSLFNIFI